MKNRHVPRALLSSVAKKKNWRGAHDSPLEATTKLKMRILLAFDKLKDALGADEACAISGHASKESIPSGASTFVRFPTEAMDSRRSSRHIARATKFG